MIAPTPASAITPCAQNPPFAPDPIIDFNVPDAITCVNTADRNNDGVSNVILLTTTGGAGRFIDLFNSGELTALSAAAATGIYTTTGDANSFIDIINIGDITATSTGNNAFGILARTQSAGSSIDIVNSGDIAATSTGEDAFGILARTNAADSSIAIVNSGDITTAAAGNFYDAYGIYARTNGFASSVDIENHGDIAATITGGAVQAFGIFARTYESASSINIENHGAIAATQIGGAPSSASGIDALTGGSDSSIAIMNSGDIAATSTGGNAFGIRALAVGADSGVAVFNGGAIDAETYGIYAGAGGAATAALSNAGMAVANTGDITSRRGIFITTGGNALGAYSNKGIAIANAGDIDAIVYGIVAQTIGNATGIGSNVGIAIVNSGGIGAGTDGMFVQVLGSADGNFSNAGIAIENSGDVVASFNNGIYALSSANANGLSSTAGIAIDNSGAVVALRYGITAQAGGVALEDFTDASIEIVNTGPIQAGFGIFALNNGGAGGLYSKDAVVIDNSGPITAGNTSIVGQSGGVADGNYSDTSVTIRNTASITAGSPSFVLGNNGILGRTLSSANGAYSNAGVGIDNSGGITAINNGIYAHTQGNAVGAHSNKGIGIANSGDITGFTGILARTEGNANGPYSNAGITVDNLGDVVSNGGVMAGGIYTSTVGNANLDHSNVGIAIINAGDITALRGGIVAGTFGDAVGDFSNAGIVISNSGRVEGLFGIYAKAAGSALGASSTAGVTITNEGDVFGGAMAGIYAYSNAGTTIVNSGDITAASLLAIQTAGAGPAEIFNSGTITGYVRLDADDKMVIEPGGTFEVRLTSDFDATGPGGNDLFRNDGGGTVHAVQVMGTQPAFVNLERFENSGLISMVDGDVGDVFTISNTVGGTDLDFVAGSGAVAVDAFLGPPGSTADNFVIDGDVFGKTQVIVNNTRPGGGVFNPDGIPVVFVPNGQVQSNAFFMPQPFDSGLFDWDVYFVPTGGGSGFFELRSFPGGGAHALPQLLTAAQDVFHTTNETWFDRTADLRVLLNGGAAYGAGGGKLDAAQGAALTPGVWLKGSGSWLEQQDGAKTSAYGRTYTYNLDRDLDLWNLEGGIDFGKKGMWAEGDALLFGVLGGAILGSLDYDQLNRKFDIEGGEVGGYVTYLNGGLFVDTLVKVDFLAFDPGAAPGFPGTLDATAYGFRTDAGYRFGGFRRGPFIEPLATIAVAWSEIDDFTFAGNTVDFDPEANVRGRLGLRVGTSHELWPSIVMEPFVIGSVWGNLSGENQATVTSLGTKFGPFTDEPDEVWGVVSTGVNFFSPGTQTSLFGKVDVAFGEETEGISAKGGMRYNW